MLAAVVVEGDRVNGRRNQQRLPTTFPRTQHSLSCLPSTRWDAPQSS